MLTRIIMWRIIYSKDVAILPLIMLADSAIMAYSWTPWWVQFYEYAGKLIVPNVRQTFVSFFTSFNCSHKPIILALANYKTCVVLKLAKYLACGVPRP
jgi:hypothetical protein